MENQDSENKFLVNKFRAFYFSVTVILTIMISRIAGVVKNLDIIIRGFELHHIHYGFLLLIIIQLFMLFGEKRPKTYLILSGISMGLVIDEVIFIVRGMTNLEDYYSTLPSTIIFTLIIILIVFIIQYQGKK